MTTISAPSAAAPRTPAPRRSNRFNLEKYGWIYMRASGVLLIVLIFGHLFINLYAGEGVRQVDFAFIAGKYSTPFWQVWDFLMLWLALIHGGNGMRTVASDYIANPAVKRVIITIIAVAVLALAVLGTLVIFTFDPCPANAAAGTLPTFCRAR